MSEQHCLSGVSVTNRFVAAAAAAAAASRQPAAAALGNLLYNHFRFGLAGTTMGNPQSQKKSTDDK